MADRSLRRKQKRRNLDEPMDRGPALRMQYDPERVGRFSERVARFLGTWRFIIWMTLFIVFWIVLNMNFHSKNLIDIELRFLGLMNFWLGVTGT